MRWKNKLAYFSLCLFVLSLILLALSENTLVQKTINHTVCDRVRNLLSILSSAFPFSLFELSLIMSPLIVFLLVRYVTKDVAKLGTRAIRTLSFLSLLPTLYILTLGISYRTDGLQGDAISVNDSESVFRAVDIISQSVNNIGEINETSNLNEIREELAKTYAEISHAYGLNYYNLPKPKTLLLSKAVSRLGIYALYSFPTGEVNINTEIPEYLLPFTLAHEYAHSLGVSGEAEANFLAYLACRASKNPYIRYSGEISMLEYFLADISKYNREMYIKVYNNLSQQALSDLQKHREYAKKYQSLKLYTFSEKMNSIHLELWDKNGASSYSAVVGYVTSYLLPE